MDKKLAKLEKHNFSAHPRGSYSKKLLALVDETLASSPDLGHQKPPLTTVLLAAKGIMYPTFLIHQMLDFLNLITMAEFYRLDHVAHAQLRYQWHIFYADKETPEVCYNPDELVIIKQFLDESVMMRECFIRILVQSCREDLQRIWLTGSNTQFWVRWADYFSFLQPDHKGVRHPFHYKLSPEEISIFRKTADQVVNFMEATTKYSMTLSAERGLEFSMLDAKEILRQVTNDREEKELYTQLETVSAPNLDFETMAVAEYYIKFMSKTLPGVMAIVNGTDKSKRTVS